MEDKDAEVVKKSLKELLQFGIYKLDNNLCTPSELRSLERALENTLRLYGTVPELAQFYGVSEDKIRNTINRKLIAKPIRRVFYPFHLFRKIVPESWKKLATYSGGKDRPAK